MPPAALPPVVVDVAVEARGWRDGVPRVRERVLAAVAAAFQAAALVARPDAEISVVLASDDTVRALNRDFRHKAAATNVLSFPAVEPDETATAPLLGDIVLALETTQREAADEAKPLEHHLSHLVVHGVLHLFGFDHICDEDAERMESLERAALASLGIPDPYAAETTH